jgi:outer membrane biosynthesis protein TonB
MDPELAKKMLDELLPQFESVEAQCAAIQQLLKSKEVVTDEELAPYLDEAGKASNVRWRATRLRIEHLLGEAFKEAAKPAETTSQPARAAEAESKDQEIPKEKIEEPKEAPEPPEKRAPGREPQSDSDQPDEKQAQPEPAAKADREEKKTTDQPQERAA